jgi:hypothetical protein
VTIHHHTSILVSSRPGPNHIVVPVDLSVAFSIVDCRLYTRGLDGIYCHDLKKR